jgi:hypothetical protein
MPNLPTKKFAKLQSMHIVKCTPRKQSSENQGALCVHCALKKNNEHVHNAKQRTCAQCQVVSMHATFMLNSHTMHNDNVKFFNKEICKVANNYAPI